MGRSNAHFSLTWLYQNFDGVLARLARSGVTTFTLTHRGRDIGKVDLAVAQPASAVSQLPHAATPLEDDDGPDQGPPADWAPADWQAPADH